MSLSQTKKLTAGTQMEVVHHQPPVRVLDYIRSYGIKLIWLELTGEQKDTVSYFDQSTIYLNTNQPIDLQLMAAARQLGYQQMQKRGLIKAEPHRVVRDGSLTRIMPGGTEFDAICFAARLLLPETDFNKYKSESDQWLAKVFVVPVELVGFRKRLDRL